MLKYKNVGVDVAEFAEEYIRLKALHKKRHRRNEYKCVLAYHTLAQRLGLRPSLILHLERLFRNHASDKMKWCVAVGVRHIDELPDELGWLRRLDSSCHLLHKLLKKAGISPAPRECESGARADVVLALCAAAALRRRLDDAHMYEVVRRALRLPAAAAGDTLRDVWKLTQRLSLERLSLSARDGDVPPRCGPPHADRVADLVLLYTDVHTVRLLDDESLVRFAEAEALSVLWQLVQRHSLEEPQAAARWPQAARDYRASGRSASLVVLQRRWYELKRRARGNVARYWCGDAGAAPARLAGSARPADAPEPIYMSILNRYPHIVTSPFPKWSELVARGEIVVDSPDEVDGDAPPVTSPRKRPTAASFFTWNEDIPRPKIAKFDIATLTLEQMLKHIEPTKNNDVSLTLTHTTVKCERDNTPIIDPGDIKTEPADETSYDLQVLQNSIPNDPDVQIKIEPDVNPEPERCENVPTRMSFTDDEGDDVLVSDSDDEDFRKCEFDNKLLATPLVPLTRVEETTPGRARGGTAPRAGRTHILPDVIKDNKNIKQEHAASCARQDSARHCVVNKCDYNDVNSRVDTATPQKGMPTLPQLQQVIADLKNVSNARALQTSPRYCCAARRHAVVDDVRRRMGVPPTRHTHPAGEVCRCCCAFSRGARSHEQLARDSAALRDCLQRLGQVTDPTDPTGPVLMLKYLAHTYKAAVG